MSPPKTAIKNVCPRCAQTTNLELEHRPTQEADNAITSHCWGQRDNVRHLSLSLSCHTASAWKWKNYELWIHLRCGRFVCLAASIHWSLTPSWQRLDGWTSGQSTSALNSCCNDSSNRIVAGNLRQSHKSWVDILKYGLILLISLTGHIDFSKPRLESKTVTEEN